MRCSWCCQQRAVPAPPPHPSIACCAPALPPACLQSGIGFTGEDCMLSYLPLAHSFDRILEELALSVGGHVGYWRVRGSAELAAAAAQALFVGLLPLL